MKTTLRSSKSQKTTPTKKTAKLATAKPAAAKPAASKPAKSAASKPAKAAKPARPKKAKASQSEAPESTDERLVLTLEDGAAEHEEAEATGARVYRMLDLLRLGRVEVGVTLVSDDTIAKLNLEWRKKEGPTDVLSFPLHDLPAGALLDPNIQEALTPDKDAALMLGDIVVSMPTARRQAAERDRAVLDEVSSLIAHGLLHLLGFDHTNDEEEREMDAYARVLEAAALNDEPVRLALVPRASLVAESARMQRLRSR
ncbi:MAG: rRNA maturation RNase YbeY [Polyangiaceae bacterium]